DAKTSGGYSSNKLTLNYTDDFANSTDVPKYWEPTATGVDEKFILGSEVDVDTKNITEIFTNGTMLDEDGTNVTLANPLIPGHYQSRPVGSRGDVEAVGVHSAVAEEWTLEWSRALDTGNDDDLQFTDTTETGEYFFGVAVFDDQDAAEHATTGSDVFKLVFEQPNSPPSTPTITPSATSAEVGDTITFEASANDPDMDTLTYDWDFDDDSTDSGASVTHSFSEVGTYDVSVTASDGKGGTSTNSVTITIEAGEEPPPEEGIPLWLLVALVIIIVAIVAVIGIAASRKKGPPTEEIEETPIEEEEE
ncbi:MAG: PKD domain-containing protein, partial [Thermoplasmata archaeon]